MALLNANKQAIKIPLEVSRLSLQILDLSNDLINDINPNSITDLAVAAEVESVVVYFDYQANHPIPVPEGLREKLDPFRVI